MRSPSTRLLVRQNEGSNGLLFIQAGLCLLRLAPEGCAHPALWWRQVESESRHSGQSLVVYEAGTRSVANVLTRRQPTDKAADCR
jgi:hypothetical protein